MSFDECRAAAATQNEFEALAPEQFAFVRRSAEDAEPRFHTKPAGYMHDVLYRFATNRGSVICFFIIVALFLYAFIGPLISPYKISDRDGYYAYVSPRHALFEGAGWWDGGHKMELNQQTYQYYRNIPGAIIRDYGVHERLVANRRQQWHSVRIDTYAKVGWVKMLLSEREYEAAKAWESGEHRLFWPVIDQKKVRNPAYQNDMNAWFATDERGIAQLDAAGNAMDIFVRDDASPDGYAYYTLRMNGTQYEVRVLYREWYYYTHGAYPCFWFGADASGCDIFTRLAHGARLSLCLSLIVSAINLCLGTVIGALEGYYGGLFDLLFERVKDIIYEVPTQVTMTLFQLYLAQKLGPLVALFFAFVFYGWISMSSVVRAQFYRFKGQDYVNASRTLGAKDSRLIFRHILPNAIGFIITVSVLSIPGVIFSEASLSYLGIVDLDSPTMASVGTMLNAAKDALSSYPHAVFFPALFISILLVCFNEFGNGLRDAFNPTLRGVTDE